MLFFSGVNLLFIGLVGEYVGRIFISINKSPQYVIREFININNNEIIEKSIIEGVDNYEENTNFRSGQCSN